MYYMNYEKVHLVTEMQSILPKKVQKHIKLAIEDIGLKEVNNIIGLKKVIKTVGLEEIKKILHKLEKQE